MKNTLKFLLKFRVVLLLLSLGCLLLVVGNTSVEAQTEPEHLFTWDTEELLEGNVTTFTADPGYDEYYWLTGSYPGATCEELVNGFGNLPGSPIDLYFDAAGQYQVCLRVLDIHASVYIYDNQWVTITDVAPEFFDISLVPEPSFAGEEVTGLAEFYSISWTQLSCSVNWGDGSDVETFPTSIDDKFCVLYPHTYTTAGSYTITLSATEPGVGTGTATYQHTVNEHLFTWDTTELLEGDFTTFTADPGYDEYYWLTGSYPGATCEELVNGFGNLPGSPIDLYFDAAGQYQVCLQVLDIHASAYFYDNQWVTIADVVPEFHDILVEPEPSFAGDEVSGIAPFYSNAFGQLSCSVNWGDGSDTQTSGADWENLSCALGPHTYTTAGSYTITVSATEEGVGTGTGTYQHTVNEPVHLFSWSPTELLEGGQATFTAISGYTNYYWQRGEYPGDTCSDNPYFLGGGNPITIALGAAGQYQYCMHMWDAAASETIYDSQWVTIIDDVPEFHDISVEPEPSVAGEEVSGNAPFYSNYFGQFSCSVNWGDGSDTQTSGTDWENLSCALGPHTYTTPGTYTVTVSVTEAGGDTGTGTYQHIVSEVAESQLTSTRATCSQFASNTAPVLTMQYGVTTNRKTGETVIKSVTPSSFTYFVKLSTSAGGEMGINQNNLNGFPAMIIDPTKVVIYDDTCASIMRSWTGAVTADGNGNLTLTGLPSGTVYVKVPYSAKSLYGKVIPSTNPDLTYTFNAGYGSGTLFTEDALIISNLP